MGLQLVFPPLRCYWLAAAVLWYMGVKLWVELFVLQGTTQAKPAVSRRVSTWSKGKKDDNKIKIKLK